MPKSGPLHHGLLADKLTFGAVYAGDSEPYFYRHWKVSYQAFNTALTKHFEAGNDYFSEFDLVSYYELIDHELLRKVLAEKVNSDVLLKLLFECLQKWTADDQGQLRHGIPQGPLSSAFLAECFLFDFDRLKLSDVVYLRYVDDVRILAKRPQPIRRALIQLDLISKRFGLVPQAQKITAPRQIRDASDLIKTIPSQFRKPIKKSSSQRELRRLFLESIKYKKGKWTVIDSTSFKFCLYRMRPTKAVLRRVVSIGKDCPDSAPAIAAYLRSFGKDADVFRGALEILKDEPVYDSVASVYIGVLATSGPVGRRVYIFNTLRSIRKSSVEGSSTLKIALADFIARINGLPWIQRFLGRQSNTLISTILTENLFVSRTEAVFSIQSCRSHLTRMCLAADPDAARYAASVIVTLGDLKWLPKSGRNPSVDILLHGVGVKRTGPKKSTVLEVFFKERMGINMQMNWKKVFGSARREVEQRCLRMQQLASGDQSARILIVDTFNDLLTQYFCPAHPQLAAQYKKATKPKKHHPDFGNIVNAKFFSDVVPLTAAWFKMVHDARVGIDLAHATSSGGVAAGTHTKPIKRKEAEAVMKGAKSAWEELLKVWAALP